MNKNILACFEIWLIRGGFKGKRTQISVQYFNNGKGFIQDLNMAMASKYRKAVMINNLAKVA